MNRGPAAIESVRAQARRQPGFALLAVLWLTTLLALVAGSFTTTARTEIQLGRNAVAKVEAEALADAGVYRAVLALLAPDYGERWRTDGTVYGFAFRTGEVRVSIQDEAGKVDLNVASDDLLQGLLATAGGLDGAQAAALVDAVIDFRDPDDLRRLNGLEDPDYRAAGLPYGAKDAPFEVVEELQQVPGATPELYRRVAPFLTVHSWQPGVDPMTAPPEVLYALPGIDPAQVEALLAARAEAAAGLDPDDALADLYGDPGRGNFIGGSDQVEQRRRQPAGRSRTAGGPGGVVGALPAGSEAFLSPSSGTIYTVRAEASGKGGGRFVREAAVAVVTAGHLEQPYRFYSWKRGEPRSLPE